MARYTRFVETPLKIVFGLVKLRIHIFERKLINFNNHESERLLNCSWCVLRKGNTDKSKCLSHANDSLTHALSMLESSLIHAPVILKICYATEMSRMYIQRVWRDKYGKNAPKAFRGLARSVGSLWVRKTFYHI